MGPAAVVALLPADEQRAAVARGAGSVRQLAAQGKGTRASRTCPHCGGAL
jgi:hypothetical protein